MMYVPKGRLGGLGVRMGVGWVALSVAVTIGLGETPAALKVITQVCIAAVVPATLIEALRLAGVAPLAGARFSQAQSEPSEVVKFKPLVGFVLVTAMP